MHIHLIANSPEDIKLHARAKYETRGVRWPGDRIFRHSWISFGSSVYVLKNALSPRLQDARACLGLDESLKMVCAIMLSTFSFSDVGFRFNDTLL